MKALLALAATGFALGLLRLVLGPPRPRCDICGRAVTDPDVLDAVVICPWHWGPGGDA